MHTCSGLTWTRIGMPRGHAARFYHEHIGTGMCAGMDRKISLTVLIIPSRAMVAVISLLTTNLRRAQLAEPEQVARARETGRAPSTPPLARAV